VEEFRERLRDPDPAVRAYNLGKLMRRAKPDDVFTFVTLREIEEQLPAVEPYLGRSRPFWLWIPGVSSATASAPQPVSVSGKAASSDAAHAIRCFSAIMIPDLEIRARSVARGPERRSSPAGDPGKPAPAPSSQRPSVTRPKTCGELQETSPENGLNAHAILPSRLAPVFESSSLT
jgi:hypothetical protein